MCETYIACYKNSNYMELREEGIQKQISAILKQTNNEGGISKVEGVWASMAKDNQNGQCGLRLYKATDIEWINLNMS